MSLNFSKLRQYKQLGLSYACVLVKTYLDEHGFSPVGKIADACGVSVSSVEKALAKLKALNLLLKNDPEKFEHEHDQKHGSTKGTADTFTGPTVKNEHQADGDRPVDPLRSRLEAYQILPWCCDALMDKLERGELLRTDVEQQLDFHQFRLDNGFRFKAHPAKFLFSAILRQFAPPEGFFSSAHKKREGISSKPQPVYHTPAPRQEAPQPTSPEDKAATVRTMLSSPLASVRRLGARLAADWGVSMPSPSEQEAV